MLNLDGPVQVPLTWTSTVQSLFKLSEHQHETCFFPHTIPFIPLREDEATRIVLCQSCTKFCFHLHKVIHHCLVLNALFFPRVENLTPVEQNVVNRCFSAAHGLENCCRIFSELLCVSLFYGWGTEAAGKWIFLVSIKEVSTLESNNPSAATLMPEQKQLHQLV